MRIRIPLGKSRRVAFAEEGKWTSGLIPHRRTCSCLSGASWLADRCHETDEVPRLIEAARKVARRGGVAGDLRREFAKDAPLRPHWVVQETDRGGRPTVRVWRLPRISHPGVVIWDEVRGSHGARYRVMTEIMERGRRSGTLADTGVRFEDLASLSKYLRETSELR